MTKKSKKEKETSRRKKHCRNNLAKKGSSHLSFEQERET